MTRWLPHWTTLASAVLVCLAFPPFGLSPLVFVALVPWLAHLARPGTRLRRAVGQAFWLSLLVGMGGYPFVARAIETFARVDTGVALVGLVVFAIASQLQLYVFAPLWTWACRRPSFALTARDATTTAALRPALALAGLALVYVQTDALVPRLFEDTLGHALYRWTTLAQAAELGGPRVLTLLIVLVNVTLAAALVARPDPRRAALLRALPAGGLMVALTVFGLVRASGIEAAMAAAGDELRVVMVQAGGEVARRQRALLGDDKEADKLVDRHLDLSTAILARDDDGAAGGEVAADLVVWSEIAYPGYFRKPRNGAQLGRQQRIDVWAMERGVPLLFGGFDRTPDEVRPPKVFNSVFLVDPRERQEGWQRGVMQTYHKHLLFPFGERMPLVSDAWVAEHMPHLALVGQGPAPAVLVLALGAGRPTVKLGITICYEDLFPSVNAELVALGADVLVNLSNDSWFGFGEPELHLANSVFRAIEARRPVIRVTNDGISALVLPTGEIVRSLPPGPPTAGAGALPLATPPPETLLPGDGEPLRYVSGVAGLVLLVLAGLVPGLTRTRAAASR